MTRIPLDSQALLQASPLEWLSEFFYLPEVLYLGILFSLFLSGPGWFSVDHLIFARIGL